MMSLKPALDLVEPARVSRSVVEVKARAAGQSGFDPWMFVVGVVVRDQMHLEAGRNVALEVIEKREKFLVPMTRFGPRCARRPSDFRRSVRSMDAIGHDSEV